MHDYFNSDYNISCIQNLNLPAQEFEWLVQLKTSHHQDALHIAKRFLSKKDTNTFKKIQSSIDYFYLYRHLIDAKFRDIKNFKTFEEFLEFESSNWKHIISNIKVAHKIIKPLAEYVENKFTVYKINNFFEATALIHGHPCFDNNYYKFCHGMTEERFSYYTDLNENDNAFKLIKKPIKNCNRIYQIRDHSKSAKFKGKIPNCIFEDPQHIILITIGFKPSLTYAYYRDTIWYKTNNKLFQDNSYLNCLKDILQ